MDEGHPMFKGLYSNLKVINPRGNRSGKRISGFLSTKEFYCPKCNRADYGNVSVEAVIMCSRCLMSEVIKVDLQEQQRGRSLAEKLARKFPARNFRRAAKLKVCERCHRDFKGRSNRQRFCAACQQWAKNERNRKNTAESRLAGKEPPNLSLVVV
jgi:hypothetical protein